jgi:hypothetical protein
MLQQQNFSLLLLKKLVYSYAAFTLPISECKKRIAKSDLSSITNCDQIHDNIVMNIVTLKAAP